MTKKPLFWIVFTALSIGGIVYFAKNYHEAFPALSVDIKMNREMALDAAEELSKKYNWLPGEYRTAVSFDADRTLQTFVELEGGGLDTFKMLYQDGLYYPYVWKVRHFQEQNPNEMEIWFTPAGKPYSFRQKLGEDEPGAALSRDSAFAIAMAGLKDEWAIDLDEYELVEESEKTQPGGRVDHSFTYQRSGFSIGENGFLRFNLKVQGDVLGEYNHYAQVPEAFKRRFSEMRSANDTIAFSATMAIYVIYVLFGCLVGIFILLRQRRVLWKKAMIWGMVVGLFQSLVQLNFMPMMWMDYNTAITTNSFLIQIIIQAVFIFLIQSALYTVSFIAAESLTRKAFPNKIQFWRLWSPNAGNSLPVLGQTIGGYLATGLFMFYAIAFYTFVTKTLGWWSPADTDYNPNILAAYFPWLTSIGISLGAGFWEECLFRAVPLAGAALIGDRYGKRNLFIGLAMGLQALIFAAAHANYPVQPAYARVVELLIPSLAFGFIYLRFGLLAGIIMHYAYDVAMISMQLFIADVPGIWVHRFMIILFLLVPLWVVLYYRQRAGQWAITPGTVYNHDWTVPPAPEGKETDVSSSIESDRPESKLAKKESLIGLAVAGLIMWVLLSRFEVDHPAMEISRLDALQTAEKALIEDGFSLEDSWTQESQHQSWDRKEYRFIWQTAGKETYHDLLGDYLIEPSWMVRYRLYEGDVEERAEEYACWVNQQGNVTRVRHSLPEGREGASLNEDDARSLALEFISETYNFGSDDIIELEARSFKKPNRLDWEFIFRDTTGVKLNEGELRLKVLIAGDQVSDSWRDVHVPEEWSRAEQEKNAKNTPLQFIIMLTIILSIAYITILGVIRWSKKQFNTALFLKAFVFFAVIGLMNMWNTMPNTLWGFKTSEPYSDQLFQVLLLGVIGIIFMGMLRAVLVGATHNMIHHVMPVQSKIRLEKGIYIGLLLAGIFAAIHSMFPSLGPNIGWYSLLNAQIPTLERVLSTISNYVQLTLVVLALSISVSYLTNNWTRKVPLAMVYLLLIGLAQASSSKGAFESLPLWFISGTVLAGVFYLLHKEILRFNPPLIPIITATITIAGQMASGVTNLYDGALMGACIASSVTAALGYIWFQELEKT